MEFLKHLEEWLHRDDLVERVWECHLEVARESDGVLIYSGDTRVNVKPYLDKTADLVATAQVDGQDLSLSKAVVKTVGQEMGRRQNPWDGRVCKGIAADGMKYVWLVGRPQGNPDFPYLSQVHLEHGVVKDESDTELTGDPDADEDAALG